MISPNTSQAKNEVFTSTYAITPAKMNEKMKGSVKHKDVSDSASLNESDPYNQSLANYLVEKKLPSVSDLNINARKSTKANQEYRRRNHINPTKDP